MNRRDTGQTPRTVTAQSRSAGVTVAAVLAATAALGACGEETADPRPATGARYSALPDAERTAAAAACRDRAAAQASGLAARQLADVDEQMLARRLDVEVAVAERAAFEPTCAATLPLVTPGLRVRFDGVTGNGITFTYPTRSDRPLTIRGMVTPAPASGEVVARREVAPHGRLTAPIDPQGRFAFRDHPAAQDGRQYVPARRSRRRPTRRARSASPPSAWTASSAARRRPVAELTAVDLDDPLGDFEQVVAGDRVAARRAHRGPRRPGHGANIVRRQRWSSTSLPRWWPASRPVW